MNLLFSLPARYLQGRPLRTTLTTLAIVFGVAVIFAVNTMMPTLLDTLKGSVTHTAGQADLVINGVTNDVLNPSVLTTVRGASDVVAASPVLQRQVILPPTNGASPSVALVGLDPVAGAGVRRFTMTAGRPLQAGDSGVAVLSQTLAQALALKVGDRVRVPTPSGLVDLNVVGISALPGDMQIYVPLEQAGTMLGLAGDFNRVEVAVRAGAEPDTVATAIQAKLGNAYHVGVNAVENQAIASVQIAVVTVNLFGIMTLFMGGFLIFNTFRTVVIERRRDIGLLRAVGATQGTILRLILVESLLQGIVGVIGGLVFGYLLALGLGAVMSGLLEQFERVRLGSPVVPLEAYILAVGLGLGITLLAGLFPALGASRVPVLVALRPQETAADQRFGRGPMVGAALSVAGVLIMFAGTGGAALGMVALLLGLVLLAPAMVAPVARGTESVLRLFWAGEGTMASGNVQRQPGRAAITASALMIGLAIMVAVGGLFSSIERTFLNYLDTSLGTDIVLLPPALGLWDSTVGVGQDFEHDLSLVPGVSNWAGVRYVGNQVGKATVQMLGIDPVAYPRISKISFDTGDDKAYAALTGRGAIANPIFAAAQGLKVGDKVQVQTAAGPQDYHIVAIGNDYLAAKINTLYISQADMSTDFARKEDVIVLANLASGADRTAVKAAMDKLLARYPQFKMYWGADLRNEQRVIFQQAFAGFYIVALALVIPALLGLINTLAINILERTREIGVLRAIGATRRQIRRLVLAESLLLAATGTALGLLAGLGLGYALTVLMAAAMTSSLTYSFPLAGIVIAIATALLLGVVASLLPARQAARLGIVQALQYE